MKVCFVAEHFPPHVGGVEVVFNEYAKRLAQKGYEIRVVTSDSGNVLGKTLEDGFEIYHYKSPSFFSHPIIPSKKLEEHIKWADIVHTTTLTAALPSIKLCQRHNKPCVLMVHEIIGKKWFRVEKNPLKALGFLFFERFVAKKNYTFWQAISKETKKDMLLCGIPGDKIKLIYHGINNELWNENVEKTDIGKFFGFGENSKIFLYSGRPGKTKGVFVLMDAIIKLKNKLPEEFKFGFILGKEPKRERMKVKKIIKKYELEDIVRMKNPVKTAQLASFRKSSFAVIVPSLTEGFGFSAAETCRLGVPIISSNAGSLPEVVSGKALFFENGNSEDLAQKIIMATGNKFTFIPYLKFDWNDSIDELTQLYKEILCV